MRLVLEDMGREHTQEAQIGPWTVDFLVAGGLVIEADGEYWHTLRPHVDKRKTKDLRDRGYVVWRIPEREIRMPEFPTHLRSLLTRPVGDDYSSAAQSPLALDVSA